MHIKTQPKTAIRAIFVALLSGVAGVVVASHCTGMKPTPCGTDSSSENPTPCENGNQGTIHVIDSYNSPSQCAGGFDAGQTDCSGQTNQVACIHHHVSYVTGCGSFSYYQSSYTTNLIQQTTPGGAPCSHGG